MRKEYHKNLIEVIGSSFYYSIHMKEINLASGDYVDFEQLTKGWVDEYRGNVNFDRMAPLHFNAFKPLVDQLVYRIIEATEDEIQRRFEEKWNDYIIRVDEQEQSK